MPEPIIVNVEGGFAYPDPATIPVGYVVEVHDHDIHDISRDDVVTTNRTESTAASTGLASLSRSDLGRAISILDTLRMRAEREGWPDAAFSLDATCSVLRRHLIERGGA